jgi:hypothetical protein
MSVIRFPVAAKLGEKRAMAVQIGPVERFKRWLFGYRRPVNRVTVFFDRARKN